MTATAQIMFDRLTRIHSDYHRTINGKTVLCKVKGVCPIEREIRFCEERRHPILQTIEDHDTELKFKFLDGSVLSVDVLTDHNQKYFKIRKYDL